MNTSTNFSEFTSKSITHIKYSLSSNQKTKFEDVENQTEEQPDNYSVNCEINQYYNQSEMESVISLSQLLKVFAEEKTGEQKGAKNYGNNQIHQNYTQHELGKANSKSVCSEKDVIISREEFKANAEALEQNLSKMAQDNFDLKLFENPFEGLPSQTFLNLDELEELQLYTSKRVFLEFWVQIHLEKPSWCL